MKFKELVSKTGSWIKTRGASRSENYQPLINEDGLISQDVQTEAPAPEEESGQNNQVTVKAVAPKGKTESLEKIQEGFNGLIDQLQGINEHLNRQAEQNEALMSQMTKLPDLLESLPSVVQGQNQLTERLLEELKTTAAKQQQFTEAVEKIPVETGKQTDVLANIDHQLAAGADTDVQMAESFNKFNQTMEHIDQTTIGQTDSIMQMSKTFATSDRYLKYIISTHNKRFLWVFVVTVSVCVFTILTLTGIIIYLNR